MKQIPINKGDKDIIRCSIMDMDLLTINSLPGNRLRTVFHLICFLVILCAMACIAGAWFLQNKRETDTRQFRETDLAAGNKSRQLAASGRLYVQFEEVNCEKWIKELIRESIGPEAHRSSGENTVRTI